MGSIFAFARDRPHDLGVPHPRQRDRRAHRHPPVRLVLLSGAMPPDEDINTALNQGWGESVLTTTLDAIKNADSTAGNIASLVLQAKIDIIRIPDFMA